MNRPRSGCRDLLRLLALLSVASVVLVVVHLLFARQVLAAALGTTLSFEGGDDPLHWQPNTSCVVDAIGIKLLILLWAVALMVLVEIRFHPASRLGRGLWRATKIAMPLLIFYYCLESFAAPVLMQKLGLSGFYAVLDVDHRPVPNRSGPPTNSDGIRSHRESEEYPPEGYNIVFLGDSMTYGYRVELEDAFPARVEGHLRRSFPAMDVRAANFGWVSSSPLLAYRALREIGHKYNPDRIVLSVDMSDISDDILYRNMIERRGIFWYLDKVPLALKLLQKVKRHWFQRWYWRTNEDVPTRRFIISEAPLEETRHYFDCLTENVRSIHSYAEQRRIPLTVFILPRSYQYSDRECPDNWEKAEYTVLGPHSLEPFRYFEELQKQVPFRIHPLLADFQKTDVFPTCLVDDPHWNADGHAVAARAMAKLLERELRSEVAASGRGN